MVLHVYTFFFFLRGASPPLTPQLKLFYHLDYASVRSSGYPLSLQLREYGHRFRVTLMVLASRLTLCIVKPSYQTSNRFFNDFRREVKRWKAATTSVDQISFLEHSG